ncbi:retrovirus-related pol polyprotein from transposon TNT 1-94 [Tanacetum coccineum]
MEPNLSWGSNASDDPSFSSLIDFRLSKLFSGTIRFRNDQIAKIIGYGDYQLGNVTISLVYYVERLGKCKKHSHKPKAKDFIQEKLYLLHMDLCGPMRIQGINGKKYILVIVDDYSRFTWVKFLRSKDEVREFVIKFLKMIQVHLNATVENIRIDNGTEFINQTLKAYYEDIEISRASLNRLATRSNLLSRGVNVSSSLCLLCEHFPPSMDFPLISINDIASRSVASNGCLRLKKVIHRVFQCPLWAIWSWRNKVVNSPPDVVDGAIVEDIFPAIQRISDIDIGPLLSPSIFVELLDYKSFYINIIVERQNRALVEAARTMLIFSKASLFFQEQAVATACYIQNRSLIRKRHNKTPYELLHNKKPDLSYLHVFGALCYPINDSDDVGKLQPKADIGIFIGYAPAKKAF